MTRREKIIAALMCMTLVYGAYELSGQKKKARKTPLRAKVDQVDETRAFVENMTRKLVSEKITEEYRYLIAQAGAKWTMDPFIVSTLPLKTKQAASTVITSDAGAPRDTPAFIYMGYLALGEKKLAIINGQEYAVGEALGAKGYYVKTIGPRHITIARENTRDTLRVALMELDEGGATTD